MKVLFLGRSKDIYSKKIFLELKKKYKNTIFVKSRKIGDKLPKKFNKNFDIIYSFRNYIILKKSFLRKIKKFAINFHPGPPKYRGTASVSMAIKNNDKFFGCVAHLISNKIDYGKILDVKKFKINKKDKLRDILEKVHRYSFLQCVEMIKKIHLYNNDLKKLKIKKKYTWSKNYYSTKDRY